MNETIIANATTELFRLRDKLIDTPWDGRNLTIEEQEFIEIMDEMEQALNNQKSSQEESE